MKNSRNLALIVATLTLITAQVFAQDTTVTRQVQNLNVSLTGFVQGGEGDNPTVSPVKITTKDLVSALATATGTDFSAKAKLLLLTSTDDGSTMIVVRDKNGQETTDTDVSAYFVAETVASVERSGTKGVMYSIDGYTLGADDGSTAVYAVLQGFTTTSLGKGTFSSSLNGTGTVNGDGAVLRGTISGSGGKTETVTIPGGD